MIDRGGTCAGSQTMNKLDNDSVRSALSSLDGWTRQDDTITKRFRFGRYADAIDFVNRVASLAEKQNHHPDLLVKYGEVVVSYTTHDAHGITRADLDAARSVQSLVEL